MNLKAYKCRFKIMLFAFISLLLLGCERDLETNLLIISTEQTNGNLVDTEIYRRAKSSHYNLKRSNNEIDLCEDSLKLFSSVILNHLELNTLDHFQINGIERYIEAGGNVIIFEPSDSVYNQYKWPNLYKILNQFLSFGEQPIKKEIIIGSLGKGLAFLVNLQSLRTEEQMAMISNAVTKAVDHETFLEYKNSYTPLIPPDHWFVMDTLAMSFNEPIEMEVLANGDVFVIERAGKIKYFDSKLRSINTVGQLPVVYSQSNGLNGMALDPDFENTGFVFFSYTPIADTLHHRISRFIITRDSLLIKSEKIILKHPITLMNGWHGINAMEFDSKGNLYFSIGDFTIQTQEVAGYGQIDERKSYNDSQATSSNSNNLLGKISRIFPEKDGTYTIPKGNLFSKGDSLTRPEIFVMGCRNPYRFTLDSHTDVLFFGDVGPDAWNDGEKGPKGYDELNIAKSPGNYGWPYLVANNKPYRDFDYRTKVLGLFFDPKNLINDSPNNTGRKELLPPREAVLWYPKGESQEFPDFRSGGMTIMIGPKYYIEDYYKSEMRFPSYFNQRLFIYDWVRGWIKTIEFDETLKIVQIEPFLSSHKFNSLIDMKFGIDGTLYLLEYGTGGYSANPDASLKIITFAEGKPPSKAKPITNDTESNQIERNKNPIVWGLLESNNCLVCHQIDKKLIGPSFNEISKRYTKVDSARKYLPKKIMGGGTGSWSGNIAMPANPLLNEDQAGEITKFILDLHNLEN